VRKKAQEMQSPIKRTVKHNTGLYKRDRLVTWVELV